MTTAPPFVLRQLRGRGRSGSGAEVGGRLWRHREVGGVVSLGVRRSDP
ncbi:hypothetical protein [Micromonospora sp. CPCC 205558]